MLISIGVQNHNTIDIYDCHNNKLFYLIVKKRNYLLFPLNRLFLLFYFVLFHSILEEWLSRFFQQIYYRYNYILMNISYIFKSISLLQTINVRTFVLLIPYSRLTLLQISLLILFINYTYHKWFSFMNIIFFYI
jgi:hypothetical protein